MKFIHNTDLPSDINGSLGNVRREVAGAYNRNRDRPMKLELLKETLQFVIDHIDSVLKVEKMVSTDDVAVELPDEPTEEQPDGKEKEVAANKPPRKRTPAKGGTRNKQKQGK